MFADEPTGNLDTNTGELITQLLFELNQEFGTTLVMVTHDDKLAEQCDRTIRISAGQIENNTTNQLAEAETATAGSTAAQS